MNIASRKPNTTFVWRITAVHTISYFVAGIFALVFMDYREHFASETMSVLMLPVDSSWVAAGPGLQPIRGLLIGLVLLPFKNVILSDKGWLKLAGLILGLSYLSTIGPTVGSFDGYIYTKIPLQYHLLGIPETLLYVLLFSLLSFSWYAKPHKALNLIAIFCVGFILTMSIFGYLASIGLLQ